LRVCRVDATELRIAVVVRTDLLVIAGKNPGGRTSPRLTVVPGCALVAVRTVSLVVRVQTPFVPVTDIIGAGVAVRTVQGRPTLAHSLEAGVVGGADVVVAAGCIVELVGAPINRVTRIIRAAIAVVAGGHGLDLADPIFAMVAQRAGVAVITIAGLRRVNTSDSGHASILGAWIVVVASHSAGRDALPQMTMVARGAHVAIITGAVIQHVAAPGLRVATIRSTLISVVTVIHCIKDANPGLAVVPCGARIAIVAISVNLDECAPRGRITPIGRAGVAVIALHRFATAAFPGNTRFIHCARVTIAAREHVLNVDATLRRIASIVCTHIAVVAVHGLTRLA